MHRLTRRDLETRLFVAITTAPALIQRGLASKNQQEREEARKRLAALLCDQIDGRGICVVQADQVRGDSANPGIISGPVCSGWMSRGRGRPNVPAL